MMQKSLSEMRGIFFKEMYNKKAGEQCPGFYSLAVYCLFNRHADCFGFRSFHFQCHKIHAL